MSRTGEADVADGPLARLAAEQPIIVCCGSGGVGKTTTAAVLALAGARQGRNAVVVTIDPAKRLANALGLDALSDTAHEIERKLWDPDGVAPPGGRLSALMLDTKSTFDHLVLKYSVDQAQGERILENTFYRNISGALAGTQEYMAMEKLHELHDEGGYDLIVIDTPPTRNALDFLDAPARLTRLLNNKLFRLLMAPTRASFRVANFALQAFFRSVSKVIGTEVVEDLVLFFQAFEGMEEGFRVRATRVTQLLSDRRTAFVLVTAPARDAVSEAGYFHDRLDHAGLRVNGLVINRIHPQFGDAVSLPPGSPDGGDGTAADPIGELYANLADFIELSKREQRHLDGLERSVGPVPIVRVPLLEVEVCDIASLTEVGRYLLGPAAAAASERPGSDG
ncbi:MAG TPA: ArsA family ATPase [Acidimicrobiia bacterium]|nr:ArsA family ATPase [Acidimicrobiia bacterium]